MYRTNIILRTVIMLLYLVSILLIDERVMFFILLTYYVLLTLKDRNMKALLLDFAMLLVLLFILYTHKVEIILKIISFANLVLIYLTSFTDKEIEDLKYNYSYTSVTNRKRLFFKTYRDRIVSDNEEKYKGYSYTKNEFDTRTTDDLERLYLYGKIRFFGYSNKITNVLSKWGLYDLVFLVVSLVFLVLLRLNWR